MSARILVIDDEANIRTMIKLALEHVGHKVDTATDGPDGIAKFGDGSQFDLVLLDQRMPGMAGIDVQKAIYKKNPKVRLIFLTAFGTIDLALEAIQAGASDFLRKPFTADTLRSAVKSSLDKPVETLGAVPVDMVCREFTRTTINGFRFEIDHESQDDELGDLSCVFQVSRAGEPAVQVTVILPAYVMELVRAYTDCEQVPGGHRFWQAMCEESLANALWHNAEAPESRTIHIDDLSPGLQRWLDSMMTVSLAD